MEPKRLKELLAFVKTTDLYELVWERKGEGITFRREAPPPAPKAKAPAPAARNPGSNGHGPSVAVEGASVIRSTMVGTFHRSDSSDRPPFVVEGTVVAAGQPVGAIEAMKIMKDVVAPSACKIVKALVANGHAVEYGQPLFEVEPQEGHV